MSLLDRMRARLALALDGSLAMGDCPSPEDIVAWQEGALPAGDASRVRAHVARCPDCAVLFAGFVSVVASDQVSAATPARPSRWRTWLLAMPAVALGVLGVSLLPMFGDDPAGVPDYTIAVQGGLTARGGDDPRVVLSDGSALEIVLSPASATAEPVAITVYTQDGTNLERWPVPVEVTDKGVIVIDTVIGVDVPAPDKAQRLWVVVARPDVQIALDALGGAEALQGPLQRAGWQAWPIEVELGDP